MFKRELLKLHQGISAEHYDLGIKRNLFQRFWHRRRFQEVLKLVPPLTERMADIGCHSGLFTEKIVQVINPRKVYGLDISHRAIAKARKRIKRGSFVVGDAHNLPFNSQFFDLVVCLEMLEHVDHPEQVLKEIYRVLKRNGNAVLLVPTNSLLFEIVWFIWNLHHPVWKHVHVQKFPGKTLEKMARDLNFRVVSVKKFNLGMLKLLKLEKNEDEK